MLQKGKLHHWFDEKGFGFIKPMTSGPDVYLHISALGPSSRRPKPGDIVTYTLSTDKKGRATATQASIRSIALTAKKKPSQRHIYLLILGYILLVSILSWHRQWTWQLLTYVTAINILTYAMYAKDKAAATQQKWRVKENTLHLLSLLGGWPSAILAQQSLRHKSQKNSFRILFWITVLANIALFCWLVFTTVTPPDLPFFY
jgi:uncharacterized membrane protein YsdA (DUF1294 family)/cold shock CspA family protein